MNFNFEWDPTKAKKNLKKHEVRFEQASEIFLDPLAIPIFDEQPSADED